MINNFLYTIKFFLAPVILPVSFYFAMNSEGIFAYHTVLFVFFVVPLLDLVVPPSTVNPESKEEEKALKDKKIFDILVWLVLPVQLISLGYFLYMFKANHASVSMFTKVVGFFLWV